MKQIILLALLFSFISCLEEGSSRSGKPLVTPVTDQVVEDPVDTPEDDETLLRPSNDIFIDNFCGCQKAKPVVLNKCDSYCANVQSTSSTTPTLYVTTRLGSKVDLSMGSLYNWCTKSTPQNPTPGCLFRFTDNGTIDNTLIVNLTPNSSTFTVDMSNIPEGKTLLGTIIEKNSGATSEAFNFTRLANEIIVDGQNGKLKSDFISQYACVLRGYSALPDGNYINNLATRHYYFIAGQDKTLALPAGNFRVVCHDPRLPGQGDNDSSRYARLMLRPLHFTLWSKSDPRTYDQLGGGEDGQISNNSLDIQDIIYNRLQREYGVTMTGNIFTEFRYEIMPKITSGDEASTSASSSQAPLLGFALSPFIDQKTGRGYCPIEKHFKSSTPLFKILKEYTGGDTEGLYAAMRERMPYYDANGEIQLDSNGQVKMAPIDIIWINETLLKKIWFHYDSSTGQYSKPTDVTAGQKSVQFYWPPNETYPYDKATDQNTYTVVSAEDLNLLNENSGAPRPTMSSPDKRWYCIPKTSN